jgi:hypothetical protein
MEKLCVICKHFYFTGWSRGYSEFTPGEDTRFGCEKSKPKWDGQALENMYTEGYRALIRTAETCPDFEAAKD